MTRSQVDKIIDEYGGVVASDSACLAETMREMATEILNLRNECAIRFEALQEAKEKPWKSSNMDAYVIQPVEILKGEPLEVSLTRRIEQLETCIERLNFDMRQASQAYRRQVKRGDEWQALASEYKEKLWKSGYNDRS